MDDTASHGKTRSLARLACLLAVLAVGALMAVGQAPAAASGTPSSANSTISVKPNPMLISEPDGSPSFEATVTVKDADGEPVSGDPVTLAVTDGGLSGGMLGSISENPQDTDSAGKATFSFTCNAGYCYAGAALEVTASDPSGLSLGPVIEYVSEIAFAGRSYTGQTDTLKLQDLAGAETKEKTVTLSLDGSFVALSGTCATDSTGSLPLPGDVGACTFTVPAVQLPSGESPPANVPAVVTVGAQAFDVTFPLQPAPALQLKPTSGPAGSTVLVGGTGFPQEKGVRVLVRFTPHGSGAASTGTNCQTDGLGGIEDEATGAGCQLTIPADSPEGTGEILAEEYDSLTEYATATATFTVEPPKITGIEISDNYPGCPGGPPAGPSCATGVHDELYLGETAGLAILSVWSTGTIELLKVPAGGPEPEVSWSSEPQPSGAIALNGVNAAGNDIGLTANANKVTTSAGVVQVEYDGFKATSLPLSAVIEPCDDCFEVNGALLNMQAHVPEGLSSKPVAGAIADVTQGEEANGGRTGPPPCIPETVNGVKGCSDTGYEHLPASSAHTCTTESAGACELIAEEGTLGESTEVEDTVTLTAPTGYTLTGVSGCESVTGPSEAPVCHVLLKELSNPSTITFDLQPWPTLAVEVGGPEAPGEGPTGRWYNEEVDGALATITPIDGTLGSQVTCEVQGGEETFILGGKQASCMKPLPPGTYEVSVSPEITLTTERYGKIADVTSTDPQLVTLKPGDKDSVSFNTAHEPLLTVNVGGPEQDTQQASSEWRNELVDGVVATITPIDTTPGPQVTCEVQGGEVTYILGGKQASCTKALPPGTYEVSVGPTVALTGGGHAYLTSAYEQQITLKPGDKSSLTFDTNYEPELTVHVGGPERVTREASNEWLNELVDGVVVTITPIDTTPGSQVTCEVQGGEETVILGGKQASCTKALPPGTYEVSVGPTVALTGGGHAYLTSAYEQQITLKPGDKSSLTFDTNYEPELTVNVGGPEFSSLNWLNEAVDGVVATITPIDTTPGSPVTCQVEGGEKSKEFDGGTQAHCTKNLPPGTYAVSVGPDITTEFGNGYVTSTDPQRVELEVGKLASVSFNTALFEATLTSSSSGASSGSSTSAEAIDGPLKATASGGVGAVNVGQYGSDPEGASAFNSSGKYIDVLLSLDNTFKELTFTDCELSGGNSLEWWSPQANSNHGGWETVSDETAPSGNPPCITVTINETTNPTLKQMTGTVFGVALLPTSTTGSGGSSTPPASSATAITTTPPATTAATGRVSLDGSTIAVESGGAARVKLTCTGTATCAGNLTLTAKSTTKKGKKKHSKTQTIGTATFSIPAGSTATVKLTLGSAGKALLKTAHGRLSASLMILESSPAPAATRTESVHLTQQPATKAKQGKKQ